MGDGQVAPGGQAEGSSAAAPVGTLSIRSAQEALSRAYVQAVISVARCTFSQQNIDVHGVDLEIEQQVVSGDDYEYGYLDVQLKSSAQDLIYGDQIHFRLERDHYDKLRTRRCTVPRILVVVLVPHDIDDWISQSNDQLVVKKCAHWAWLQGAPKKDQGSVTVHVPLKNVFDVPALCMLLKRVRRAEPLVDRS